MFTDIYALEYLQPVGLGQTLETIFLLRKRLTIVVRVEGLSLKGFRR